jgi:fructokinase
VTASEDLQPPSATPPPRQAPPRQLQARSALVIGEALVDIVVREGDPSGTEPQVHPGGSPLNVAYGLARLGIPTVFRAHVGDDEYGQAIIRHLESAGVALEQATALDAPTSTATAHVDAEGRAEYEFDIAWQLDETDVAPGVGVLHTGSIASVLQPGAAEIRRLFAAARCC